MRRARGPQLRDPLGETFGAMATGGRRCTRDCMILLEGVPVDRMESASRDSFISVEAISDCSQSNMGDLVGDVINIGDKDPKERAYRSMRELMFWTARSHRNAVYPPCHRRRLQRPRPSIAIHNVMLRERPDPAAASLQRLPSSPVWRAAAGRTGVARDVLGDLLHHRWRSFGDLHRRLHQPCRGRRAC